MLLLLSGIRSASAVRGCGGHGVRCHHQPLVPESGDRWGSTAHPPRTYWLRALVEGTGRKVQTEGETVHSKGLREQGKGLSLETNETTPGNWDFIVFVLYVKL